MFQFHDLGHATKGKVSEVKYEGFKPDFTFDLTVDNMPEYVFAYVGHSYLHQCPSKFYTFLSIKKALDQSSNTFLNLNPS